MDAGKQEEKPTSKTIIFWRHFVGIMIVLLVSNPNNFSNADVTFNLGYWVGMNLAAFVIAGIVSGLLYLFFTSKVSKKIWKIFIITAWVFVLFHLFGQWVLPGIIAEISPVPQQGIH